MYQTKPFCAPPDAKQLLSLAAPSTGQGVRFMSNVERLMLFCASMFLGGAIVLLFA